jgi:hypothetical protein
VADLYIRVRDNNRRIVRGVTYDDKVGRYRVQCSEGETVVVILNLADWLGSGVSVSSSTIANDGVTCTKAESSGVFTLTASAVEGRGDTDLTIVASDGRTRVERLRFEDPVFASRGPDYDYWSYFG